MVSGETAARQFVVVGLGESLITELLVEQIETDQHPFAIGEITDDPADRRRQDLAATSRMCLTTSMPRPNG